MLTVQDRVLNQRQELVPIPEKDKNMSRLPIRYVSNYVSMQFH